MDCRAWLANWGDPFFTNGDGGGRLRGDFGDADGSFIGVVLLWVVEGATILTNGDTAVNDFGAG